MEYGTILTIGEQVPYIVVYKKRNTQITLNRIVDENSYEERMMVDNKESFTDSEEEMVDVTDENETLNVNVTKRYNFSKRSKRYTAYRRTQQDAKMRKEK